MVELKPGDFVTVLVQVGKVGKVGVNAVNKPHRADQILISNGESQMWVHKTQITSSQRGTK